MSEDRVDIIIPLSDESCSNNDELRICLRSIDKYAEDAGRIIICTASDIPWLSDIVTKVYAEDTEKHLKDANIISKVITGIKEAEVTGKFAFFSDDQCLLSPITLGNIPPIFNTRGKHCFSHPTASRWYKRVFNTFKFLEERGIVLKHNYESHTPQVYDAKQLMKAINDIDYKIQPGFTINTLFMGLLNITEGVCQSSVKLTVENEKDTIKELPTDKWFCGYNDIGFNLCMKDLLFQEFSAPCKYEKQSFKKS